MTKSNEDKKPSITARFWGSIHRLVGLLSWRQFWTLMSFAKRTGGWDIWLGEMRGYSYDDDKYNRIVGIKPHWHCGTTVIYVDEY